MSRGEFKDLPVAAARPLIIKQLIDAKQAAIYFEPAIRVVSRSRDECIVALTNQWYLRYGDQMLCRQLAEYVVSPAFKCKASQQLKVCIESIGDWGFGRKEGQGTALPWDEAFLIDQNSDSTLSSVYSSIAHLLQGDISGSRPGDLGIDAAQISHRDWEYVLQASAYDASTQSISKDKLDRLRDCFEFWSPLDLEVAGKYLMSNLLVMSLLTRSMLWPQRGFEMLHKSLICHGSLQLDSRRMSKAAGNHLTIREACQKFGSDAVRLALANGGDSSDDGNVEVSEMEHAVLKLTSLEDWIRHHLGSLASLRLDSEGSARIEAVDRYFSNSLNTAVVEATQAFEEGQIRAALKLCFFDLLNKRDEYLQRCGKTGMKRSLLLQYVSDQLLLLFPIAPHCCEVMWSRLFFPAAAPLGLPAAPSACLSRLPVRGSRQVDQQLRLESELLSHYMKACRSEYQKQASRSRSSGAAVLFVVVNRYFADWQLAVIQVINELRDAGMDLDSPASIARVKSLGLEEGRKRASEVCVFFAEAVVVSSQPDALPVDRALRAARRTVVRREVAHVAGETRDAQQHAAAEGFEGSYC